MPRKGRGNKSRAAATTAAAADATTAAAGNPPDPSRSMADDVGPPEILTLNPRPASPPDDQQPLGTAAVTVTGSSAFPVVIGSPAIPVAAASPAVSIAAVSPAVSVAAASPAVSVASASPAVSVAAASPAVPVVSVDVPETPAPPTTARKGPGKRKKSLAVKKLAAIQEKLDFLSQNLRPVPFAPCRAPDLGCHERLFRILGLWDFAHLNLAADPLRPDLLSDLIAHYTPASRCSKVCEFRINVNRADLARALSLPVKKTFIPVEDELTLFKTEEASAVLTRFIQEWILVLEDTCVVPHEVVLATETVKEGHAFKVDWAGLVWTLTEKDLQEATKSGQCLYASHLQLLIKHQRPELFKEEAVTVSEPAVNVSELEMLVEVTPAVEEDNGGCVAPAEEEDGTGAVTPAEQEVEVQNAAKTATLEDFSNMDVDVDANGPQLSLGLGSEVDGMLGLEENCDSGVEPHWLTGGKDVGNSSHYMQRCSLNDITALDCDTYVKEEEDNGGEAEDSYRGQFETKFNDLEQLNSTDLLQAVTDGNVSYSIPQHSVGQSSGDFLVTGTGTLKNIASGSGPASPFSFGKQDIDEMDDGDEVHPFSQINPQKRIRSKGQWGGSHGTTSGFTADFEQMQLWANKIRMNYSETERALANTQMQLQYANDMLQQKDQMIQSLEKARMEEAQKRELEACRFEHELRLLTRVVSGYKSALVETRNVFAEYRKKFPQGEEPLYKDVEGGGGLVLSTGEIEKLEQLKKEEEMCRAAEVKRLEEEEERRRAAEVGRLEEEEERRRATEVKRLEEEEERRRAAEVNRLEEEEERRRAAEMMIEFAKGWNTKFTEYDQLIANLAMKLMKHKEDFLLVKESYATAKLSEAKAEED